MTKRKIGIDVYDDIIDMPHHVSKKHPQMSLNSRAAQFAPFAALVGYDDSLGDMAKKHITDWNKTSGEGIYTEEFED